MNLLVMFICPSHVPGVSLFHLFLWTMTVVFFPQVYINLIRCLQPVTYTYIPVV